MKVWVDWVVLYIVPEKDKGRQAQRMELKNLVFSDGTFEFKILFMKGKYHEGRIFYRWQDVANWHNTHLQEIPGSVISVLIHLQ